MNLYQLDVTVESLNSELFEWQLFIVALDSTWVTCFLPHANEVKDVVNAKFERLAVNVPVKKNHEGTGAYTIEEDEKNKLLGYT